jgi:uncharacterized small protein (DUF1192 family)
MPSRDPEFEKFAQLDRLEELREELLELGIQTLAELDERIAALERDIADEPAADDEPDGPV